MVCVACGWSEYDGALFCSKCTAPLYGKDRQPARGGPSLKRTPVLPGQYIGRDAPPPKGLLFVFLDSKQRVLFQLKGQILIGRSDPAGGYAPDLDLERHGGGAAGVSRRHALIEINHLGVVITDLSSTNGTRLNNFDLPPELPYTLNHGDELYFGHLLAHVFFE